MDISKYNEIKWHEILTYDPRSPSCLRWKISPSLKIKADTIAGSLDKKWKVRIRGHNYYAHIIVWLLNGNKLIENQIIDHIDRNASNNCIENLRSITQPVNMRNRKKAVTNKSSITGVYRLEVNYKYMVADWYDIEGRRHQKRFNIDVLGEVEATQQASAFRAKMIEKVNKEGAGYTADHGK